MPHRNNPVPAVVSSFGSMAAWNSRTLLDLVGDQPEVHARLLMKFLRSAETQVAAIMNAATQGPDGAQIIGDIAHVLKSTARSVGALHLGEVCFAMEVAARANKTQECAAALQQLAPSFEAAAHAIRASMAASGHAD